MNRILAFVGAVAFVAAQSTIALAAHPGTFAPIRPIFVRPHAAPVPRIDMKPLTDSRHFTLQPTVYGLRPQLSLNRWYWLPRQSYPWYPAFYQPACYANNWSSPGEQQPWDTTIGSLVDGKANLLSPQSFNGFATNATSTPSVGPFNIEAGFFSSPCGQSNFI